MAGLERIDTAPSARDAHAEPHRETNPEQANQLSHPGYKSVAVTGPTERNDSARPYLPTLELHDPSKPAAPNHENLQTDLNQLLKTEAVAAGLGAAAGGATLGLAGKYVGSFAQLILKPVSSLSVSNHLALEMAKVGATRGGLIGLALGAAAFGAYEILKQSAEHPERAPDPAALI